MNQPPYRDASDAPKPPQFPPRTKAPSLPGMSSSFDKLVEANLQLVRILRIAVPTLVALALTAVIIAGFSAWTLHSGQLELQTLVATVLQQCYGKKP